MVDFKDYQTIFTFHSDSANTRPGFVIKVEQEECQDSQRPQQPQPVPPEKSQREQPQPPPKQIHRQQHQPHQPHQPPFNPQLEPHFDIPVAEPPLEQPYIYPPHHPLDYEHLVDYPIYDGTAAHRTLPVSQILSILFTFTIVKKKILASINHFFSKRV